MRNYIIPMLLYGFIKPGINFKKSNELLEFCQMQKFEAHCNSDEVILMTAAKYGRMNIGECVKTDFGFVGCSEDVLHLADHRCSGQRKCSIGVPDPLFENTKPCNDEFKSYLQVSYVCIKVITPPVISCTTQDYLRLTEFSGTISNLVTEDTGCGGDLTPWYIHVMPGQKINLTLYDFAYSPNYGKSQKCLIYGYYQESESTDRETICGGRARVTHIHESISRSLHIYLSRSYDNRNRKYFLIKYKVIGCATPQQPMGGWVNRDGDHMTMGCNDEQRTLKLTCMGNEWDVKPLTCQAGEAAGLTSNSISPFPMPLGWAITLIIGIAVIVSACIFIIGLFIIARKRKNFEQQHKGTIVNTDNMLVKNDSHKTLPGSTQKRYHQPLDYQSNWEHNYSENEYAYVWDSKNNSPNPSDNKIPHYYTTQGIMPYERTHYPLGRNSLPEVRTPPQYYELEIDPPSDATSYAEPNESIGNDYGMNLPPNHISLNPTPCRSVALTSPPTQFRYPDHNSTLNRLNEVPISMRLS